MYFHAPERNVVSPGMAAQVYREYKAGIAVSAIAERYGLSYKRAVDIIADQKAKENQAAQVAQARTTGVMTAPFSQKQVSAQQQGMFREAKAPEKVKLWKEPQFKRKIPNRPRSVKGVVTLLMGEGKNSASEKELEVAFSTLIPEAQAGRLNSYQIAKVLRSPKVKDLAAKKQKLDASGSMVGPVKLAQLQSRLGAHLKKLKLQEKRRQLLAAQQQLLAAKQESALVADTQAQMQQLGMEMAELRALISSHLSGENPSTQAAMEDAVDVALAEAALEAEAQSVADLTKEELQAMGKDGEDLITIADNQVAAIIEEVKDSVQDASPVVAAQKVPMKLLSPKNMGIAAAVLLGSYLLFRRR